MKVRLTDLSIQKLPYKETGNQRYWDTILPGFGIRVTSRSKSFFVVYGKKRNSQTLGKYPDTSLKTARKEAMAILAQESGKKLSMSLSDARTAYLKECQARLSHSTYRQYKSYLNLVDKKSLEDVTRADINTSHPQTVSSWKAFYNWCIKQQYVDRNPFQLLQAKNGVRERVLTDDEIKKVWAYEHLPFSNIVKLLLLTGLRRTEVTKLKLIDGSFKLAPEHTKNGKGHTLPATDWAKEYYGNLSYNGWSKAKTRLDRKVDIPHWTLHDLRRTFATIHARIGTPIHVVEALINHQSGTISGIKAVYIKHNYIQEAEIALANYEEELKTILARA